MRVGRTMRMLADVVSACPGISKAGALRAAGLPDRGRGAYRPVNRAIAAGLVLAEPYRPGHPTRLYATECDQRLWHLRAELLRGNPTAERANEIVAEVEALRAGAAGAYAELQGRRTGCPGPAEG